MYKVTKQFVSGILKGLILEEITSVKFKLGKTYKALGSSYTIIAIETVK